MDFPFISTLKSLSLVDVSEWDEQVGADGLKEMTACMKQSLPVIVLSLETGTGDKPEEFYYNVKLPSGRVIDALSGFHLHNINQLAADQINKATIKLGCQYTVELVVDQYTWGVPLGHGLMADSIKAAIETMLQTTGFAGYKTTVGAVTYETDYEIPG